MKHRICTHCNKPVILVPAAAERAKKFGGTPADYLNLFRIHARCQREKWYEIKPPHNN